jgi:four helix bundle protein
MRVAPRAVRDLKVWQKSILLVESCYRISAGLPVEERYGLVSQIRRAAASVPASTAEGFGRWNSKEFSRFLAIASGSLRELETHLVISCRLGFLTDVAAEPLFAKIDELARMLYGLRVRVNEAVNASHFPQESSSNQKQFRPRQATRKPSSF